MKILNKDRIELSDDQRKELIKMGHTLVEEDCEDLHYWIGSVGSCNKKHQNYPNLKYVQLISSGYDKLDLESLKNRGIQVLNASGVYSKAIAEYILSYILAIYKEHNHYYNLQKAKYWNKDQSLNTLSNKKVIFLGAGSIAQTTAKLMQPFDVDTVGLNSDGRLIAPFDECEPLDEGLKKLHEADIVISSLPSNKDTLHILDYDKFKTMKKDALFINVGRGDVVDEAGLLKALEETMRKVVLDVFEEEPLDDKSPLWTHPKVILTPHHSNSSPDLTKRHTELLMSALRSIEEKKPLVNKIS